MNHNPRRYKPNSSLKKLSILLGLLFFVTSCSSLKKKTKKEISSLLATDFYSNQFTGLLVVDTQLKDTIYNLNSYKYFTPASTTKIFTLFTALKNLPDNIPALRYVLQHDTLYFEGTGDPSFLHPYLKDSTAYRFLKKQQHLTFSTGNFQDTPLGAGWSWDDFHWYYAPERSAFPIHGNVALFTRLPKKEVQPAYFRDSVFETEYRYNRNPNNNKFYFTSQQKDSLEVPFKTSEKTTQNLLANSLEKTVHLVSKMPEGKQQTLSGIKADSLYIRMMHESDNFIAEQVLLLAASELTDTLAGKKMRRHMLANELADLKQTPRWVDGSGLSRYNLFTPQSMVHVLYKLHAELPRERLFRIFPAGGVSGTLKHWYGHKEKPYIYAKSGSLGNNYNLCGYLITKSGKTLLFSFMNNHFRTSPSEVKLRMQEILEALYKGY